MHRSYSLHCFHSSFCLCFVWGVLICGLWGQSIQAANYVREGEYTNTIAQISELVDGYVSSNDVVGLSLVLTDTNGIIWSQGFGWADREESIPADGDTIYRLASLSKLFATIGTLREQEQGHLLLDDPISDYMNGFNPVPRPDDNVPAIDYGTKPVTVRAMLCHLSGIQNAYTPYSETFECYTNFLAINIPSASTDLGCLPPDCLVCYNNNGFQFAEYLITRHNADALSYSEYIKQYMFDPLGMTHSGFDMDALAETGFLATSYDYAHNRSEREYMNCLGTGGALSSANDMAQFLRMIMRMGLAPTGRVLSAESVAAMLQDQTTNIDLYVGNKSLATGLGWDSAVLADLEYAGGGCSKFGAIITYGVYSAIATNHDLGIFVGLNTPQSDVAISVGNTLLQKAVEEKTGLTPPTVTLPTSSFATGNYQSLADSLAGYYVNGSFTDISAGDNCLIYGGQNLYLRDDGWWSASNSPSFLLGFTNLQGFTFSIMKQPAGCYIDTTVTGLRYEPPASIITAWSNRLDTLWLIGTLPAISYNRTHEGLVAGRIWTTNNMLMLTLPNIFLGQADKGFDLSSDYVIEAYNDDLALVQGCGYTIPGGIDILEGGKRFRATNFEWQNTDTMPLAAADSTNIFIPDEDKINWFAFDAVIGEQYSFELSGSVSGLFMLTDADGHYLGESVQSRILCWTCPASGRYYAGIYFDSPAPAAAILNLYADTDSVVLDVTTPTHSTIDPSGTFRTNRGSTVTFDISCDEYWQVSDIITNGSSTGISNVTQFICGNIQTNLTFTLTVDAQCTISNTPLWWLAQYGWTNDFETAANADPDNDGLPNWQEYTYSTCPTNANSDGDQYNDAIEALTGANPTHDDSQTYGAILSGSAEYALYTSNNIGNLAFGYAMAAVTSNQALNITLQPEACFDLQYGSWTNIDDPYTWNLPAPTNIYYYRIQGYSAP